MGRTRGLRKLEYHTNKYFFTLNPTELSVYIINDLRFS